MNKFLQSLFLTLFVSSILAMPMFSQIDEEDLKNKLPQLSTSSNAGKEYWFSIPPCYEETVGDNFIRVFVLSPVKTKVVVEVPGSGFYKTQNTSANGLTVFDLTPGEGQPFLHGFNDKAPPAQIYKGKGIHILANDPIVVYVAVRYKYTSDGFLVLPVSGLGKEYVAATSPEMAWNVASNGGHFAPWINVTAPYDNTKLLFQMGGDVGSEVLLEGGTKLRAGQTGNFTLNRGDVIVFSINNFYQDPTGSKISGNKPISVVSGHFCNNIPAGNQWCDYTVEMELPIQTWGKTILVPKIPKRVFSGILGMFAKDNNTDINRNGTFYQSIPQGGGGTKGTGWQYDRVWPNQANQYNKQKPAAMTSNKPFYMMYYNPGIQEDQNNGFNGNSDPFTMVMTPLEQFQNEIMFCTPNAVGGEPFTENYLNVVVEADDNKLIPNDLEFGTWNGNAWEWQSIRNMAGQNDVFEPFKIDGNPTEKYYIAKNITLALNGVFRIKCRSRKFASYSFGYGPYDSYGYPTSVALADLTKPTDEDAPIPEYTIDCDGNVVGGKVTDMPNDPTIRSGLNMVYMMSDSSYNYEFEYTDFIPGETAISTGWKLTKLDRNADAKAVIVFSDSRGNVSKVRIESFATLLEINPKTIDFGTFKIGESASNTYSLTNKSKKPVLIDSVGLQLGNQGFKIEPLNWDINVPIESGESKVIKVTFTADDKLPQGKTLFIDSLGTGDSCKFRYFVEMMANTGAPLINAGDHTFTPFNIRSNTPDQTTIRLSNNSESAELVITSATALKGGSPFASSYDFSKLSTANPLVIPIKGNIEFNVTFKPNTVGQFNDQIVFTSDASGPDYITYLEGTGIEANLSVNRLNWGELRVSRPQFPIDKKEGKDVNGNPIVTLENSGTNAITINTVKVTVIDGDVNSFIMNDNGDNVEKFINITGAITLNPGEKKSFPVYFRPTALGKHTVELSFENNENIPTKALLEGIGILPTVNVTPSIDFGSTIVNDLANPKKGTIKIENPGRNTPAGQYGDVLNITNLTNPNGEVAWDFTSWGNNGFRLNLASVKDETGATVNLNGYKLAQGSSLTIDAEFVAKSVNTVTSVITLNSDALIPPSTNTTTLNGSGLLQGVSLRIPDFDVCIGSPQVKSATFSNTGNAQVIITNLNFDRNNGDLVSELLPSATITLNSGEFREFKITFTPNATVPSTNVTANYNTNIVSNSNGTPVTFNVRSRFSQVSSTSKDFKANQQNVISNTEYSANEAVTLGNKFGYKVFVNPSTPDDMRTASVRKFSVKINFPVGIIEPLIPVNGKTENTLQISQAFADDLEINMNTLTYDRQLGEVTFMVNLKTGRNFVVPSPNTELFSMVFKAFFPSVKQGEKYVKPSFKFDITHELDDIDNSCFSFDRHDPTTINIEEVCADILRTPEIGTASYALKSIAPNPVSSRGADINFSVAFDSEVEIRIVNANSEVVAFPVANSLLKAGEYKVAVPVDKLSNGIYFIEMNAGNYFNRVEKLVIEK